MHDTEDKNWWVRHGERLELEFVERIGSEFDLDVEINPAKSHDTFAPDLILDGELADLKVQNTPFFTAGRRGFDPQHTVTFNRKDLLRYQELYPRLTVVFWIEWTVTSWPHANPTHHVRPMSGVWTTPLDKISGLVETGRAPLHRYGRRIGDTAGNAQESYLLDLRWLDEVTVAWP